MSDSSDSNELDQYGVGVKTPPHDEQDIDPILGNVGEDTVNSLPDFSFLDGLSADEEADAQPENAETESV